MIFNQDYADSHRENTFSNETQAITGNIDTDIWVLGTLSQLVTRASYTQIKF